MLDVKRDRQTASIILTHSLASSYVLPGARRTSQGRSIFGRKLLTLIPREYENDDSRRGNAGVWKAARHPYDVGLWERKKTGRSKGAGRSCEDESATTKITRSWRRNRLHKGFLVCNSYTSSIDLNAEKTSSLITTNYNHIHTHIFFILCVKLKEL